MQMAAMFYTAAKEAGEVCPNFYVIDTDDTCPTAIGPGEEFEYLSWENGGPIIPLPCEDWQETASQAKYALEEAKEGDWIIVDVMNRVYDFAQLEIGDRKDINIDDATVTRGLNGQGFGAFEGNVWNLVSRVHDSVFNRLMFSTPAHVLMLAHITDIVVERGEKRERMVMFENVGVRPRGRGVVAEIAQTVVIIWTTQDVPMDGGKRKKRGSHQSKTDRHIYVTKDRGKPFAVRDRIGNTPVWTKIEELRATKLMPENILSDEELAETESLNETLDIEVEEPDDDE
tara:strand:+ start:1037 stop:1894 length:858 start_codon:yes stop_codon:yes gene_type:complete